MRFSSPAEHFERVTALERELDLSDGPLGVPCPDLGELTVRRSPATTVTAPCRSHRGSRQPRLR